MPDTDLSQLTTEGLLEHYERITPSWQNVPMHTNVWAHGHVPNNHGKTWTNEDRKTCALMFIRGRSIEHICVTVQRVPTSVLDQLYRVRLIEFDDYRKYYRFSKTNIIHFIRTHSAFKDTTEPNVVPTTSKGTATMDKNIAALLKEDTYTVLVTFEQDAGTKSKPYTFISDIPGLAAQDYVVVNTVNGPRVGVALRIDDGLNIEPNSEIKYQWVIAKLPMAEFEAKQANLEELEKLLAQGYRTNLRRSFAQAVLADLPDDARNRVSGLLK